MYTHGLLDKFHISPIDGDWMWGRTCPSSGPPHLLHLHPIQLQVVFTSQICPLGACIHAPRAASTCSPASVAGLDGVKGSEGVSKGHVDGGVGAVQWRGGVLQQTEEERGFIFLILHLEIHGETNIKYSSSINHKYWWALIAVYEIHINHVEIS